MVCLSVIVGWHELVVNMPLIKFQPPGMCLALSEAYLVLHNGSGRLILSAMFTTNNSSLCTERMSDDQQGHAHQGEAVTHLTVSVTAGHFPENVWHVSIRGVLWKMFELNSCSNSFFFFFSVVHYCLSIFDRISATFLELKLFVLQISCFQRESIFVSCWMLHTTDLIFTS